MERMMRVLVVGFTVVALATAAVLAGGCGGADEKEKSADLGGAVAELETAFAILKEAGATMTVGDLKKTQPLAAAAEKVIKAADNTPGTDATEFETAFNALRDAVYAYPDDANLVATIIEVMPKALAVLAAGEAL